MPSIKRLIAGALLAVLTLAGGGLAFALTVGVPQSFVPALCGTPSATGAIFCLQDGTGKAVPFVAINPSTHQVEIAPPTSYLHASTNAALSAWSLPIVPLSIHRDGFYAPGDGGAQDFVYSTAACTAVDHGMQETGPNGGCWIAAATRELNVKVFGAYGDGTHDDGPFVQAAVNAALASGSVFFPASGAPYPIKTMVTVGRPLHVDAPDATIYVGTAGQAFEFAAGAGYSTLNVRYAYGDGVTATSKLFQTDNAPQFSFRDSRVEKMGLIGTINGGFYHFIDHIRSRNLVTGGFVLDKAPSGTQANGVDAFFNNVAYDTDTGNAQPTRAYFEVLDFDGLNLSDYDLIHAGQVAMLWIRPQTNRSGDHLIGKGFFDLRSSPAIKVEPAAGAKSDRVNLLGGWISSGTDAIEFDGAGLIEDWNIRNNYIYNNACDGIAWNNTNANPSNLTISGNKFSGNSALNAGVCSDIIINGTSPVKVSVAGNVFNDGAAITAARPSHNVFSPNPNAQVSVGANDWTYSGAVNGHLGPMNGTTQTQFGGYRLLAQASVTSAVSSLDLSSPDLASYTDLVVEYDTLRHSTGADVTIAFSPDGGNTFSPVAMERCSFQSCTQDRQPYLYGARSSTDDYQGTARIAAVPGAYKAVSYGSTQWIGAGDGLSVIATLEQPAPINLIRVGITAGTMTAGTVRVYGRP